MKVHPDTIRAVLTPSQRLTETGKPKEVAVPAYQLVDTRGKPITIGDEVAVGYGRAGLAIYKIKGILEYAMEISERVPVPTPPNSGMYSYQHYSFNRYPTDAVTYVVILDSPGSMKRPTDEVALVA